MVDQTGASGLYSRNKGWLPGGAPRLAALLIAHLCPISSLFAPCDPGAALRHPLLVQRIQATSLPCCAARSDASALAGRSILSLLHAVVHVDDHTLQQIELPLRLRQN